MRNQPITTRDTSAQNARRPQNSAAAIAAKDNPAETGAAAETPGSFAYFHEGRVITLLLLGAIYFILALSLSGAGWTGTMRMEMLIFVVAGAIAMGSLMAFSRFDSFFMLSHSFATGLAWVFYLMTFLVRDEERVHAFTDRGIPELQARAYFLLERWLDWVEAAINQHASNDNVVFIFEISYLVWWLTYLGVWSVFRHGHVWRGVLMAGIALLVNTHYAPNSVIGFLVAYCIIALLLLAWTTLIDHRQRWRTLRINFNEDINFDFMRSGFMYTMAVIALAFIAPNMGRNLVFHDLLQPINYRWEEALQEWNRLYQGLNRQGRAVQTGFGRTLTLGGERSVSNLPIMDVTGPQGRYWRAVAFDRFTGRQWINTSEEENTYRANESIPVTLWTARTPITQTITIRTSTGNVLLAMPDVVQASIPLTTLHQDYDNGAGDAAASAGAALPGDGELTWARSRITLEEGDSYEVISNQTVVSIRELREMEADYPAQILDRYLQLPDSFSPRVAELAAEVMAGAPTTYDKIKALERYLRAFEYDEGITAPAADVDPLEYFLFDIQRGYCDYYASAMATMLRSQGIPARTASGYAEGAFDPETNTVFLTEQDAHTWVEVYFPQYGWIEFEPTAGESTLDRPAGTEFQDSGLIPGMDEQLPDDEEFLMADGVGIDDEFPEDIAGPVPGIGGLPARRPLISTSIAIIVLTLIAGVWLMRRRMYQGPKIFVQPPQVYYERLLNWTARLNVPLRLRRPGMPVPLPTLSDEALTPYERETLLVEHLPQGTPFISRITEIFVQFRYSPRPQGFAEDARQELSNNWRRLRPVLWRAWLRKKLNWR
ncbi:MAG: transglutaminaseTgpA domain-containing protein [Caldilineaceae bacterium]|nr:transglutaminaseTgpA domain-containing protein [Caldilineaceae bacterium]